MHWHWIKGHAAQRKKPDELSWPENLNEFADNLSTAAYNLPATEIDSDHWPEQVISVIVHEDACAGVCKKNCVLVARLLACSRTGPIGSTGRTSPTLCWIIPAQIELSLA